MIICSTKRLRIRRLTLKDASFIRVLVNDPDWLKYIGDRNIRSEEDAKEYLEKGPLSSYARHGFGLYMMELQKNDEPIGLCGFIQRDFLDCPDLGFAIMPAFRRKGYTHEASMALLCFAHEKLGLSVVKGLVHPSNLPSIQLLQKLGMRYEGELLNPQKNEKNLLYFWDISHNQMPG